MYAIIDIETTGGNAPWHKITEICILIHDGENVIDRFQTLINPERYIPPNITMLTGISNEMVENAPKFYEVAKEIFQFTEGKIFVAHNVNFDYNFIKQEFESLGGTFLRKKLCTVRLSRKLIPGLRSYSLGNLCSSIGINITDRHRAAGDAEATAELFGRLLKLDSEQTLIKHALNARSREGTLPPNISKEKLDAIPEKTGVYYFYDNKGKVIYIGKAANLHQRIVEHFTGNTHTKTRQRFHESIYDVHYELSGSEFIALLMENEAIKKHYPRYNKSNKKFELNYGYYTYEDQRGYLRLSIAQAGKRDKPFLTFTNQTEATTNALLRVKKHHLCLRLCNIIESSKKCVEHADEVYSHFCPVCHEEEGPDAYNERFIKAFLQTRNERSFVIRTKGRTVEEEAFAYVEKGRFLGYGFISSEIQITNYEDLKDYITTCYDTNDSQSIINAHLKKSRQIFSDENFVIYKG